MKSLVNKIVRLALLFSVMGTALSPAWASSDNNERSLDPTTSSARIFLGSAKNPDSVNVGVARVTGTVALDSNHPENSVVYLSIYPADEDWGAALSSEGKLPDGYVPDTSDHTLLTFKSERVVKTVDGKWEVTGNLMLTRVERNVTFDANEAYAGPVYGDPVIRTATQTVTFVFPATGIGTLSPAPTTGEKGQVFTLSASARISHEDFKELSPAISETNWPSVVANKSCETPSTIGEDYSGVNCSGTEIAVASVENCQVPGNVGEDYRGPICTPPDGDLTTIALELKLTKANVGASAEMVSGDHVGQ